MTPKEKAEELINRYLKILAGGMYDFREEVKQCALVCAREVITELNKLPSKDLSDLHYWTNVENEINKLL